MPLTEGTEDRCHLVSTALNVMIRNLQGSGDKERRIDQHHNCVKPAIEIKEEILKLMGCKEKE